MQANTTPDSAQLQPTLKARTWPQYAMMVHGSLREIQDICLQGGLQQPGAAQRVQQLRHAQLIKLSEVI